MSVKKLVLAGLSIGMVVTALALFVPGQYAQATPSIMAQYGKTSCSDCHTGTPQSAANATKFNPTPAPAPAKSTTTTTTKTTTATTAASTSSSNDVSKFVGKNVKVTASALNVRATGSAKAKIIGVVTKNTVLTVKAEKSGWLEITYKGKLAWVYGAYVALAPTQPAAPVSTTKPTTPAAPVTTPKPPVTVQTATYVGEKTCLGCHTKSKFDLTKHTQSFKPITSYKFTQPLGNVVVYDGSSDNPKSATIDFNKVIGVQMDHYVVASIPGFTDKYSRVGTLVKDGDGYKINAAGTEDVNKDGKDDWMAENYSCGSCHSPVVTSDTTMEGVTCEACHGPGSLHVAATTIEDKVATMPLPDGNTCLKCHTSNPTQDAKTGAIITNNHYGTRDYTLSPHASNGLTCLTCHNVHGPNANGQLLKKDNPNDICATCHGAGTMDVNTIMFNNPSDPHGHTTADHSFGAVPLSAMTVNPTTKNTEITDPTLIAKIKKKFPLFK